MKKIQIPTLAFLAASFLLASACGGNGGGNKLSSEYTYTKNSEKMPLFETGDDTMDLFLADFLHRNLRYDEMSIGGWGEGQAAKLGEGAWFGKEWESLALSFLDSSANVLDSDRAATCMSWVKNIPVDKFGYVWNGNDVFESAVSLSENFKQGWPFPNYTWYTAELPGWEFNTSGDAEGWRIGAGSYEVENGYLTISASNAERVEIEWPEGKSVDAGQTPFIETDVSFLDTATFGQGEMNVGDIQIMFKNSGSDVWYTASQREYSTRPYEEFSSCFRGNIYFDMYNHPEWGGNTITDVKLVILPKEGELLNADIKINFFRMQYDSRQANNGAILITSAKTLYEFSHDTEFLAEIMPKVMRAAQFYITNMGGKSGLVSTDFFVGHEIRLDEYGQRILGYGIGDGYWDMLSLPRVNIYTNIYFYKAVRDAAYLLRACAEAGIEVPQGLTINTNEGLEATCNLTAEYLEGLMGLIEEKFRAEFWNERTGRFHAGYSEPYGCIIDYGFTYFNLEAIVAGLATEEQAKSVYAWLDGDRIVASQTYDCEGGGQLIADERSTGEDIYIFEFAPRGNTADNSSNHYLWTWAPRKFGYQLQNGGAAIFMSYYDLVGRAKYLGVENAYKRLCEIRDWYMKVYNYSLTDDSATGGYFYWNYYESLDPTEEGYEWILSAGNLLEGSNMGTAGSGLFGLDYTFPESALLWRAVPEMFMGMTVTEANVLCISPELPAEMNTFSMENLKFSGLIYDIAVGESFVQINSVRGFINGEKLQVTLKEPEGSYKVYIDGVATTEYSVKNGKITVIVPFKAGKVSVK